MSQKSTISISFKLEGDVNGFTKLTMDADSFRKVINASVVEAEKLKSSMINFAALATGIDSVEKTLSSLQGVLKDLSSAYAIQVEAETQLAVNMRNTMDAREEDIQSIKDFCSAQQQIGIVGDEVQLAGAQEMATYLEQKASLEKLIPVMNDMVAQQYGYNHTAENAVSIATMLGKVMQGQTTALSRLGYSFNEVQEEILKRGTEMERAAVLAEVISESVGGMNAELAKTDTGKLKQLENNIGDIKEKMGELAQGVMPWVTMASNTVIAAAGVVKLATAVKALSAICMTGVGNLKAFWIATATLSARTTGFTKSIATCRLFVAQFCTAVTQGTKGLRLFATAWRGMLISTGIGIAIAAVTAIIAHFALKTDEATESANKFLEAEERAKRESEEYQQLKKEENSLMIKNQALIDINISRLKDFNGTKKEEKKLVDEMNNTYGETMGYFSSVAAWYEALIANSEAYCRQMVLEAKTRKLADLISEKEQSRTMLQQSIDKGEFSTERQVEQVKVGTYLSTTGGAAGVPQDKYENREIIGSSEKEQAEVRVKVIDDELDDLNSQLKNAMEEASSLEFKVKGTGTRPAAGLGNQDTQSSQQEKTRLQEINELIAQKKDKYINASESEREEIRKNIEDLNKEKQSIELLHKEAERLTSLSTLDDIDKEISYQRTLRGKASKENIAGIDAEIKRLEKLREEIELSSHTPVPIDQIKTYSQLNDELSYYNALLEKADATQREALQAYINQLQEVKKNWDDVLDAINKPGDISTLDSIEKLDEAISYYQARQKKASGDEIQNIQKTIDAHERKRAAMQRGIELPSMKREADEINKLTGREYKLKISGMGFDELTAKIRELQRMLDDVDNPVTESQRKDIMSLMETYKQWRKEGVQTFDTYRKGWDGLKGIGSGVESLTSALEGNGNAWQKITGIVDGFLQIYDGIKSIVEIIGMFAKVSDANAVSKTAEAGATIACTEAQAAEAATAEVSAAAKAPVIAANKLATASYMELAAASYFAAHASIPFAGFGIASGFVSAATAMVETIGVMPFADGGIVSGPTLGLVGEYAGARNNPEVIAPLDRLRALIEPSDSGFKGKVTFKIKGRELVGILEKETNLNHRS